MIDRGSNCLDRTRTTTTTKDTILNRQVNSNLQKAGIGLMGEVLVKKQLTPPPAS